MTEEINSLTGVDNGNGGIRGEIAYAFGKIRGTTHCSLCDITHRGVRRNPEWSDITCEFGVPFDLVHLNERTPQVEAASRGRTPRVLAHTDTRIISLLGPDEIDVAAGDAATFATALRAAATAADLDWPRDQSPAPE